MTIVCSINYDSTVVYPKQYLTGIVGLQALRTSLMEFIVLDVVGIATCEWPNQNGCIKIYKSKTLFKGYQEFFRSRHTLVGGDKSFSLSPEPQIYHFKTFLPQYLPPTWSGQFGSIEYISKVIIKEADEPLQMFASQITVQPYRNLNLEKHLLTEVLQKINRTFRFGCITLGNVEVSIWLPLCGIAAGQSIPILCTITNNSKVCFSQIVFALTQTEIYRSTDPVVSTKTVRQDISKVTRSVEILRGRYEYYAVLETDHTIPPTNQYYRCNCFQLAYEILVSVEGSMLGHNAYGYLNIHTPGISIIIGTQPLANWNIGDVTQKVIACANENRPPSDANSESTDNEIAEILKHASEEFNKSEDNLSQGGVDEANGIGMFHNFSKQYF